jgi:hypothetical protein
LYVCTFRSMRELSVRVHDIVNIFMDEGSFTTS